MKKRKKKDTYSILSGLIQSLGCGLFQYGQYWYIIGINRQKESELTMEQYSQDGIFIELVTVFKQTTFFKWYVNPTVKILPPWKNVRVDWDKKAGTQLLPETVVKDIIENPAPGILPEHWQLVTNASLSTYMTYIGSIDINQITYNVSQILSYYQNPYIPNPTIENIESNVVLTGCIMDASELNNNYLTLKEPIYIKKPEAEDLVNTSFYLKGYVGFIGNDELQDLRDKLENGDFNDMLYFGVTYKQFKTMEPSSESLFLTNILDPTGPRDNSLYNFKLSVEDGDGITLPRLVFTLDLKEVPVLQDGYYSIRIYPLVSPDPILDTSILLNELTWEYPKEDTERFEKIRDIDFTTKKELTLFHGDSAMNLTNRRWLIDSDIEVETEFNDPQETILIEQTYYERIGVEIVPGSGNISWYNIYYGVTLQGYSLINDPNTALFVKKEGSSTLEPLTNVMVTTMGNLITNGNYTGYILYQVDNPNINIPGDYKLKAGDQIYVQTGTVQNYQVDYIEHALERWRRFEHPDEEIRFLECINRMYHDTVKERRFIFTGTLEGLLGPLDILSFEYHQPLNYVPIKLNINLSKGRTEVSLTQNTHQNVIDYVAE